MSKIRPSMSFYSTPIPSNQITAKISHFCKQIWNYRLNIDLSFLILNWSTFLLNSLEMPLPFLCHYHGSSLWNLSLIVSNLTFPPLVLNTGCILELSQNIWKIPISFTQISLEGKILLLPFFTQNKKNF